MTTLIYVDFPEQVPFVSAVANRADCVVVAARPVAAQALEQAGIAFRWLEEFYDHYQLREYDDEFKYPMLRRACRAVDRELARLRNMPGSYSPLYWNFYGLTFVWDNVTIMLAQGDDLIRALRPSRIVCFGTQHKAAHAFAFAEDESLVDRILPLVAQKYGVPIEVRPFSVQVPVRPSVSNLPASRGERKTSAARLWNALTDGRLLEKIRRRVEQMRSAFGKRQERAGARCVLMLAELCPASFLAARVEAWTWGGFEHPVLCAAHDASFVPPAMTVGQMPPRDQIERALRVSELVAACRYKGIDWSEIAMAHLAEILPAKVMEIETNYVRASAVLEAIEPDVIVVGNLAVDFQKIVSVAARAMGLPVVCSHHGQLGDNLERGWNDIELPFCTHYLLYSPAAESYIRKSIDFKGPLTMRVVGSSHLDKVRRRQLTKSEVAARYGIDGTKPIAVYVTIPPHGRHCRLAYTDTDNTMYRNSVRICEALLSRSDLQILVKGLIGDTPRNAPLITWLAALRQKRIIYVNDMRFSTFLDAADLFVVDYPGLTLMECLTRDTALYICNDCYRWIDGATDILREEAVFEHHIEPFCERLRADLKSGEAFRRRDRERYMCRYGDPFGDSAAAERVANAVVDIVQGAR
jgi:hypothetical protein